MLKRTADSRSSVLIAAGGTGGHVFPALAVAECLRERNINVLWVGTRKGIEARVVPEQQIELHSVNVTGVRGKHWSALLLAPLQLSAAIVKVVRLAWGRRVVCMLGTGGYVSAASGAAAILLRKPLFLQEQNSVAGTTNKLLAPFARTVFTAYPSAFAGRNNVDCCGNPLRSAFREIPAPELRGIGVQPKLRVLVVGGSLGASALNAALPPALAAFSRLPGAYTGLEIIHQSGPRESEQVVNAYRDAGLQAEVQPFIENMASTLQAVDVVIARAGALTVSELTAVGVAAILVPYPHAIDDHQTANAQWLVENGAGTMIAQPALNTTSLLAALESLLRGDQLLQTAQRSRALARNDAAAHIAAACEACIDAR